MQCSANSRRCSATKKRQRLTSLRPERRRLCVCTKAGLTNLYICCATQDFAKRLRRENLASNPKASLELVLPLVITASGYSTKFSSGKGLRYHGTTARWGWRLADGRLVPQRTDLPAAYASLLEIVRCRCKSDCSSQKCTRRKHGLECSAACGSCIGQSCANSAQPDLDE